MQCSICIEVSANGVGMENDKQYVSEFRWDELESRVRPTASQGFALDQDAVFKYDE
jgi:hypothetical protein